MNARRRLISIGAAVAVVAVIGAIALWPRHHRDGSRGGSGYCLVLARPSATVASIDVAIGGHPSEPTLTLAGLRAMSATFYGASVADEAPEGAKADASLALAAFRDAVAKGSTRPLTAPDVRSALHRLQERGPEACPDAAKTTTTR